MAKAAAATAEKKALSHNLQGQRLGRKGRGTRERILAATERMLASSPQDNAISLSAVAREAKLGMTTLYLYFSDLTELLLAVLNPIMESANDSYVAELRDYWPDETLGEHCLTFVRSYHDFWQRHTRILHLRNSYADAGDQRMREHRIESAQPVIRLLVSQMVSDSPPLLSPAASTATVLLTGLERMVTVTTDVYYSGLPIENPAARTAKLMEAEARVLELGIRDQRAALKRGEAAAR